MGFAFCAEADFMNIFDGGDSTDNKPDLNLFIGIAGDFTGASAGTDALDLILYVFSYNGGTEIGSFGDFESGDFDQGAFVIAVGFEDDGQGSRNQVLYFGTDGSVIFDGGSVLLSTVDLLKVEEGDDGKSLGSETSTLDAALDCITFEEESK